MRSKGRLAQLVRARADYAKVTGSFSVMTTRGKSFNC